MIRTDNKDTKKEIAKMETLYVHSRPQQNFNKVLDMLKVVNKKKTFLQITYNRFQILF